MKILLTTLFFMSSFALAGEGSGTGMQPETSILNCINGEGEATGAKPEYIIYGESDGTGARSDNPSQCTMIQQCGNQYILLCNS